VNLGTFRNLLSPAGQEALQAASDLSPRELDFLRHFDVLHRCFPADLARAALEVAILRREAVRKFPFAGELYFTRQSMEQASNWEIAVYRARRYQGFTRALDLGCSVGSDTMALSRVSPVVGIDRDPLRLAMACANRDAFGTANPTEFVQADLQTPLPCTPSLTCAIFFDPARRADNRRAYSVHAYSPPLAMIQGWLPGVPALGAKISPGVNLEELSGYDAEVEFISLEGELKEAVLWFGPLRTTHRRATLLPGPHSLISTFASPLPVQEPKAFLYEPDPAVLRAGLVAELGAQLNAAQLDADIAYLTADEKKPTPFAKAWAVEAWFPFQLKRLRAYLRQHKVGQLTVKKRGSPLEPETLIGDLRLSGEEERTIFLTHLRGKPIVVVSQHVEG